MTTVDLTDEQLDLVRRETMNAAVRDLRHFADSLEKLATISPWPELVLTDDTLTARTLVGESMGRSTRSAGHRGRESDGHASRSLLPLTRREWNRTEDSIAAGQTSISPQLLRARPGEPNALKASAQGGCSPVRDPQSNESGPERMSVEKRRNCDSPSQWRDA